MTITQNRFFLSDFVAIQRNSFLQFLEKGLIEEISKRNPINNASNTLEIFFYSEYYQLSAPKYNPRQAILKGKSYASRLYIPVQLTDRTSRIIQIKWVYLCDLPIMTKRGHFIINGAARVSVNQIIRSPGIYYQTKLYENFNTKWDQTAESSFERHYADLICQRGTWLRLEVDKDKKIWGQTKKGPKIPIMWLLLAMGLTEKSIFTSILDPARMLYNMFDFSLTEKTIETSKEASQNSSQPIIYWDLKKLHGPNCAEYIINNLELLRKISTNPSMVRIDDPSFSQTSFEQLNKLEGFSKSAKNKKSQKLGQGQDQSKIVRNIEMVSNPEKITQKQPPQYIKNPPEAWARIYALFAKHTLKRNEVKSTPGSASSSPGMDRDRARDTQGTELSSLPSQSLERNKNLEKNLTDVRKVEKSPKQGTSNALLESTDVLQKDGSILQNQKTNLKHTKLISNTKQLTKEKDRKLLEEKNKQNKKNLPLSELGRQFLFNKFMNPRTYDLSKYGRLSFNKKFNLSISPNQTTLTPQDLLAATNHLLKVEYGLKKVDDIDNLKNRRVRTSGELIQLQFGTGLLRLEKSINQKMNDYTLNQASYSRYERLARPSLRTDSQEVTQSFAGVPVNLNIVKRSLLETGENLIEKPQRNFTKTSNGDTLVPSFGTSKWSGKVIKTKPVLNVNRLIPNTKAVNSALREFFGTSPLSQFMDQINPLAEITHKRRLSSMGPGGVTRDSATLDIRGIHPSHYGRICPVETPEGKNTGLVNSLTTYARVNKHGYIETPFYKVFKGQVQQKTGMYYFSADKEEKIRLGAADLFASDIGFLDKSDIPVRIEEDFTKISRDFVQYAGVSPSQMVSIATSLIPFLEHDDANRALMGSNMQRQAVPIINPERPIVGTGLEARVVCDSGHALEAKIGGVVTYVSSDKVIVYSKDLFNTRYAKNTEQV